MPDWKKLVREHLPEFSDDSHELIVSELAAHLEDDYQNALSRGLREPEAYSRAVAEIQWHTLARRIRRATKKEDSMNYRTKMLWLPAVVNMAAATGFLVILETSGFHPRMLQVSHMPVAFPLAWFFTLPFSAAAAAALAKKAHAPTLVRLIAGLAPSLSWLAVFCAMTLEFLLDRWQFPAGFPLPLDYFLLSAAAWIVLPAAPLLLGTFPFLREPPAEARVMS